jgi:hypothetical protein
MGVPFDFNETCGKVTGGFATLGSAGRKAKPTRLKTAEFSTGSMRTSTSVSPRPLSYSLTAQNECFERRNQAWRSVQAFLPAPQATGKLKTKRLLTSAPT